MEKVIRTYWLKLLLLAFLCIGCKETLHESNVSPLLRPRHLDISVRNYTAPSAKALSTKLSVSSTETPWTFSGWPSWVTLNPSCGSGNADVEMSLTENFSADTARYSLFFFADDVDDWDYRVSVSVNQPAATPYLTLSMNDIEVTGAATEHRVEVTSNAKWSVASDVPWIKIEKQESSFLVMISDNQTGDFRKASIVVKALECEEILTVSQLPAHAEVTNKNLEFENSAASAKFAITSETSWTAFVSDTWLQVSPEQSGAGSTEVTIDLAPNTGISKRKGYVTFCCGDAVELLTIQVVQEGLHIESNVDEVVFDAQANAQELQINSNVDWVVTFCPQWVVPSRTEGSGDEIINLQAQENVSTYERSGYLIIESLGLSLSKSILLTQKGKTFTIGETVIDFSDDASTNKVDIITDGTWESFCNADWVELSPSSGCGNSTLSISVIENISPNDRIAFASVVVSDKTIELTIRQQGKFLSLDDSQLVIPSKGGSANVFINTNDSWEARLEDASEWLALSTMQGDGDVNLTITATDNASVNERTEVLGITTKNNLSIQLPIRQEARYLKVNMTDILFFSRGGTSDLITIETNGAYKISQTGDWFALRRSGNSFTVVATENKTDSSREGCITLALTDLKEGSYEVVIPVKQVQVGCSFTLSDYAEDTNQDSASGDGDFNNSGYNDDIDWNASIGSFTVTLKSYTTDNNWDANSSSAFTVNVTGFVDDKNWNNNDSIDTTLGKDNFGDDSSLDNDDSSNTTFDKDDFSNDEDCDTDDSSNTAFDKDDFGDDKNWDE